MLSLQKGQNHLLLPAVRYCSHQPSCQQQKNHISLKVKHIRKAFHACVGRVYDAESYTFYSKS